MSHVWKPGKLDRYWIGMNYEKTMRRISGGFLGTLIAFLFLASMKQEFVGGSTTGFEILFAIFWAIFGLVLICLGVLVRSGILGHTPQLFGADFWYYFALSPISFTISYLLYLISAKTP